MLVVIALRNLFRNGRRTALSLLIVSIGIISLLLTAGFVRNSFDGLRDAVIQGGLGHLEVTPAGDGDTAQPAERSGRPPALREWLALRAAIDRRPRVRAVGAVIQFAGVATAGESSASFIGLAVEPERERRMGMDVKLRSGTNLAEKGATAEENRVLLGVGLAHALHAAPGDTITVMAVTPDGSLNAVDMISSNGAPRSAHARRTRSITRSIAFFGSRSRP